MINKADLQKISEIKGLSLANAEKDYLLDLTLLSTSRNTKNELIFKGGTCLYKFYKLSRFSEDLDFSRIKNFNVNLLVNKIKSNFENFNITAKESKNKLPLNTLHIGFKLKGPLFTGNDLSYSKVAIDINIKSEVYLEPIMLTYKPIYQDIPEFKVLCMDPEEIFAEKVRALMMRKKARDLFDLDFLIKNKIYPKKELIEKKMKYYNKNFDIKDFIKKTKDIKPLWDKELKRLVNELPEFDTVCKDVCIEMKNIFIK